MVPSPCSRTPPSASRINHRVGRDAKISSGTLIQKVVYWGGGPIYPNRYSGGSKHSSILEVKSIRGGGDGPEEFGVFFREAWGPDLETWRGGDSLQR